MATRSRRKAKQKDKWVGGALVVLGALLMCGLGYAAYLVINGPVVGQDFCPPQEPAEIHLILIDRSDPITGQQAQRFRQEMDRLSGGAAVGARFDVYAFEGDSLNELHPIFKICRPKHPKNANELTENRERLRRRYEQFESSLSTAIDQLLQATSRQSSPIMESLRAASLTSFGPLSDMRVPLQAIILSDMVQHTAQHSQFRTAPNFPEFEKSREWPGLRAQLKGAQIRILYLDRPGATRLGKQIQLREHIDFWAQFIGASGGRLVQVDKL